VSDSEEEVAFFFIEEEGSCSGWDTEELSRVNWSECDSLVDVDLDSVATENEEVALQIDTEDKGKGAHAEIIDSGCSRHLTPNHDAIINYISIPPKTFRVADKGFMKAVGMGDMLINVPNGDHNTEIRVKDVLYSPGVGYTLLSVGRLDDSGYTLTFGGGKCVIHSPDGKLVGTVPKTSQGLYKMIHDDDEELVNMAEELLTLEQLHRHLGHVSAVSIRKLIDEGMVEGLKLEKSALSESLFCKSCVHAKATRKPIPKAREGSRAEVFGEEVHSDLWGPAPVETKGGRKYYITFMDDATRLTHLYLLRTKDEAFKTYKEYEAWCQTQLDARIKVLHSDRGGEYMGSRFCQPPQGTRDRAKAYCTRHASTQRHGRTPKSDHR
jgi:hypothetical protein